MERRLAAILAADVVGFSRLMGADEAATLDALKALRAELIDPAIAARRGRTVKLMGDGALVEFASAVDAVECAVAIQRDMGARNAETPVDRRIEFRIGINLGDISIDGDDIYGDGVNVAARLEGLATPGGIAISANVHDQLAGRVDIAFADGGEQTVKNIARPLHVWRWPVDDVADARPALARADKPSIAVLPFANMSGDDEQEYFADGITEDIITALSRIRWFFVIARNTTFTYKGKPVDVANVARELGVRYVLEGSVRRAGQRVRITAQLIDGDTGNHLWAERYDRDLEDIFAVQDEITENIAGAIEPQIIAVEGVRAAHKTAQNLDAWDLVIRAMSRIAEFSRDGSREALDLLERAIAIDPGYARAHAHKAWTTVWRAYQGWDEMAPALAAATEAAEKAVQYDAEEPWAYIGWVFLSITNHDNPRMMSSAAKAIELNPNFALAHSHLGAAHALGGNGDAAFEWIDKARRLSPRDIFHEEFDLHASFAHFQIGDYEQGAEFAHRASMPRPEHIFPHLIMACCHGHLGNTVAAHAEIVRVRTIVADFTLATADRVATFVAADDRARFLDGLRMAGLPQ